MMTDGTAELLKLTELLRVGLKTVRDIALIRPVDHVKLMDLAARAEVMAVELDAITGHADLKQTQ